MQLNVIKSTKIDLPRQPWNSETAPLVLAALQRSGLSISHFAAEHGLCPKRIYYWRNRLSSGDSNGKTKPKLLPVRLAAPKISAAATSEAGCIEIDTPRRCMIRVRGEVDLKQLTTVLAACGVSQC